MNKPLISILMTIYNHQNFLKDSINSIIKQNYNNWELIAINNGSTDDTSSVLKKIKDKRIKKVFLKKNIGRTNCLNYGLKKCKGKYVAILDSDDISKFNRVKLQLNFLEKNKKIFLVGSNYYLINENKKIIKNVKNSLIFLNNPRSLLYKNLIAHSTVMYRKSMMKKIGNYPKSFKYAQDYAFYLKIFKKYKIHIMNKNLVKIRAPHIEAETSRVFKTKTITSEELRLLLYSYKNFILNFHEKLFISFYILKKYLKLILRS